MYSPRNRHAMITDDSFQIQDWLRSNGNHDRSFPEFDHHHRIRPLSPDKRYRISAATDGRGPDRRRQLKSMESLLGLSDENLNGKHLNSEVVTRASPDVQDSLDRALMDFEETLALAFQSNSIVPPPRGFSNHNIFEGDESNFNKLDSSFDSHTTTGSSGYSTKPDQSVHRSTNTFNELQLIREQMAKSLEIIRDLEEQVKMVPLLKAQISSLTLEKQRLSSELNEHREMENANTNKRTGICGIGSSRPPKYGRAVPFADSTKDVGVSCAPICRDVGVTTLPAAASTIASTMTDAPAPGATTESAVRPATADAGTQSLRPATVRTTSVGVWATPRTYDASVTARPTVRHVGCTAAAAVAVEPTVADQPQRPPLAAIARATQTDAAATAAAHTRGTQTEADAARCRPVSRATQTAADAARCRSVSCATQTMADATRCRPVSCATQTAAVADRRERATQTSPAAVARNDHRDDAAAAAVARPMAATIGQRSKSFHQYTTAATISRGATPVQSRIPRLKPLLQELNRKVLLRQDTYTKTAAEEAETVETEETSRDSLRRPTSPPIVDDGVKSKESSTSMQERENALPESDMSFKPIRDDSFDGNPSNEMKGALKVLNDSLKKTSATLLPRVQLKQAIDVVREEWFKVASSQDCCGRLVKNYVDCFTSYSPVLLEFIINMTDSAGNTVMHYAISHENFDVVAAILDTRACNTNLTNDAGYSSIMLVSLAKIKNEDDMKIIKRLFKSGNVNLQAKKHGQTTLMLAVSHGKTDVVKLLLDCGADLNIQDEDGSTALMCAAEHGLLKIVNILLSCPECDVTIADNDGSTALSIAMEAGYKEIGIALYAKQHNILSREFNPSKTKRSRSAVTVMPSNSTMTTTPLPSLKKSPSLQPQEYATLESVLRTRNPQ